MYRWVNDLAYKGGFGALTYSIAQHAGASTNTTIGIVGICLFVTSTQIISR